MQRQVTNQVQLSRFKDEYLIYMAKEQIYVDDIDPYNLMNIKPLTIITLLEKYSKLKIQNHPDKGGETENFITITNAINNIKKILNACKSSKSFNTLKQSSLEDNTEVPNMLRNCSVEGEFSITKFNQMFEKHKFEHDMNNEGYGDKMYKGDNRYDYKKSTGYNDKMVPRNCEVTFGGPWKPQTIEELAKSSPSIAKAQEKIEFKDFHDKFKKNKQKHIDSIIEYRVPEAHNILNGTSQTLGLVNSNFSGNGYTDYMEAFDQSTMIDDSVPIKQMTLEEMKKNRENQINEKNNEESIKIREAEKKWIEENEKKEWERKNSFVKYQNKADEYSKKMNKLFIN